MMWLFNFYSCLAFLLLLLAASAQDSSEQPETQVCQQDNEQQNAVLISSLVEWIKANGGIVDDRQVVKRQDALSPQNVYATSFIPEGTLLLSVPWDLVLEPKDYSDKAAMCEIVKILSNELEANKNGESEYGPFLNYLETLTDPFVIPSAWSRGAKDLLEAILGENLLPEEEGLDGPFEAWKDKCNANPSVANDLKTAAMLVIGYSSPNPSEDDQYWYHMVPFYNLYNPNEDDPNTVFIQDNDAEVMNVVAERDIEAGEAIHTPMGFGETAGAQRRFIHSGMLERRHWFTFTDPSAPIVYQDLDVKFDLDRIVEENGKSTYNVTWVDGIRPHSRSFDLMEKELERITQIATDVLPLDSLHLLHSTTEYEQRAIEAYSLSLIDALTAVLQTRHEPRPVTPWTIRDYEVAGVNLGTYNLAGVKEEKEPKSGEQPYELFENFDIADRIIGNECWKDMIEYRRQLKRPALSFYVDKVARKRWLPTQGMPQSEQYVLKYGFELAETGTEEEEAEALYNLIPDDKDYAAKPSHHSEGVSVWLVSHDTEKNVTAFSSTARQLTVDEKQAFDKMNVAKALSKHLHAEATDQESLTLRNVKPGVVVEERFVEVDRFDRAPVEFNCFVIWGRLWVAQLNYIKKERRKAKTWLHRDGSAIEGKEKLPPELDYIDWPHIVEMAETLGRNKDMFRADIFVGLPASSPSLREGATREERVAAVEYAINECEIYPTTNFQNWPQLAQEGARLWVAGYKMLKYRTVPNDEVPDKFVEVGSLTEYKD